MTKRYIYIVVLLLCCCSAMGQAAAGVDSVALAEASQEVATASVQELATATDGVPAKKDNIFKKFIAQLLMGNKDKTFEKPIDISFAAYPSYTNEASFGLGAMVSGLYRIDRRDSLLLPSDVKLLAGVSLTGQYYVSIEGHNFFNRKHRLNYKLEFQNKPLDFWGISYEACNVNPKSTYTRQGLMLEADYTYMLIPNFYIGGALDVRYNFLTKIGDVSYLQGQNDWYYFTGVGVSLTYDTRNSISNPTKGIHIMLKEMIYPKPLGTAGKNIFSTLFIGNYYQRMWKGSVLAFDLYGEYNGENVPWPLRPEIGEGNSRMRGFYRGRYIDNNMMSAQMELRQHIYKRLGVVAWVGCGTVFPSFKELKGSSVLLNYGLGVRLEFKHNVNLRIDYGFGHEMGGFVITLSEAF